VLLLAFDDDRAAHISQDREPGLSEETILRWIRNKELKAYRLGKTYRITKEEYQEFLDQRYTGKPDDDQRNE
jgi:excisionase family DNA binding protein